MPDALSFGLSLEGDLIPHIANLEAKLVSAINGVIEETALTTEADVRAATPRASGRAAAAWTRVQVPGEDGVLEEVLENRTPYINVLEFGAYPVRSRGDQRGAIRRDGAWVGGDFAPGPRTTPSPSGDPEMLSPGNVSRQAPFGIVRRVLALAEIQFVNDLEEELDKALSAEGEYRERSETIDPGRAAGLDILGA